MPFSAYTRTQLRDRLKAKYESVPFWVDAECNAALNEALQWYNLYTGVWKTRLTMNTVADQVYYTVPSTMLFVTRAEFNGKLLNQTSIDDLDNGHPGWEGQTTADTDAPSRPLAWAPNGLTEFVLWPADAVGANSLLLDGVIPTPVLTSDVSTVDLDDSELDAVIGEALFILCAKDPGRLARALQWHQEFLTTVMAVNARLNAANGFRAIQGEDLTRQTRPFAAEARS